MSDEDVLALETRRWVYQAVRDRPGIHLREIACEAEVPLSTVRHHVRYLEDREMITAEEDGQFVRFFPTRTLSRQDKAILKVLRREKPRRIVLELLSRDGQAWYQGLVEDLGYPSSTLGLYLKELVERGIVKRVHVGRTSKYALEDPERLRRLLLEYRASFYDKWVDRVLEIVEESWSQEERGDETGRPGQDPGGAASDRS